LYQPHLIGTHAQLSHGEVIEQGAPDLIAEGEQEIGQDDEDQGRAALC